MNKLFTIALLGLLASLMAGCASTDPHYTARSSSYGAPTHVAVPSENTGNDMTIALYNQAERVLNEDSLVVTFDIVKFPRWNGVRQQQDQLGQYECEVLIGEAGAPNQLPVPCDDIELKGKSVFVYYTYNGNSNAYQLDQARGEYVQNGFCLNRSWSPAQRQRSTVVWSTHDNIKSKGFWGALARGVGCN